MFWIHLLLLLAVILIGIRHGGIAFGLLGGLGVVMTFVFGIAPGQPPVGVMLIILAVVAASATLEATGGLSFWFALPSACCKHPEHVVFSAQFVLTLDGTGWYRSLGLPTTAWYL